MTALSRPIRARPRMALYVLASLLFAVPVLGGIALSLVRLAGTPDPSLGVAVTAHGDAASLLLGGPLYQDPAAGYTAPLYTPLFSIVTAGFDWVHWWDGWPLLITIAAELALVATVARLATGPRPAPPALLAGVGIGALAWWLVANVYRNDLYDARPDQFAWALALVGLVLVPRALAGSRRSGVAAVLLLSAGFWAKQNTAVAIAVVIALALAGAAAGAVPRRPAVALTAALVALNLALLGAANLLTGGWEWFFNFALAQNHALVYHGIFLSSLLRDTGFALAFAAATWLALRRRPRLADLRRPPQDTQLALLLLAFCVVGAAAATYFRHKQGGEDNQYIGVVWALALLGALGWRRAGTRALPSALVVVLFVVALTLGDRISHLPGVDASTRWDGVPADLRAYARTHLVYHEWLSDLNRDRAVYPSLFNFEDLLAGGRQPLYLVRGLLDRRFDAVSALPDKPLFEDYEWAYGKWEQNYLWKLNRVIAARYAPAPGLPDGLLARRPGPDPARWMRACFGPFPLAATSFRIHDGGGFWCRRGQSLVLADTPAPESDVVAPLDERARGTLVVGPLRSGARVAVGPLVLTSPATVSFAAGRVSAAGRSAPLPAGELRLAASRASGAVFDLSRLRLR